MSIQRDDRPEALPVKLSEHTQPLAALAASINVPLPTIEALIRAGKGPPVFKVGRRVYCRVADFNQWLDDVATGKVDATLNSQKKRRHIRLSSAPPLKPKPPRRSAERTAASP